MEIKHFLAQFDLIGKKADVYLAILELGSGTVIEIARKSEIKRNAMPHSADVHLTDSKRRNEKI